MTDTQPGSKLRWIIVGVLAVAAAGGIAAMSIIPPKTEPKPADPSPPGLPPLSRNTTTQTPTPNAPAFQTRSGAKPTVRPVTDPAHIDQLNADLATSLRGSGEPWEYDPATNKHWDPRRDHGHWHDGPPPKVGEDGQPIQWYYDPQTKKHWDPRPGHEHWHDGPVPNPLPN